MNHGFKSKFDEMRQNSPAEKDGQKPENQFFGESSVRNLCFTWPNGRQEFLNYAYLVKGKYSSEDGNITLVFTTDEVVLKGIHLDRLFSKILLHAVKYVVCTDARYNQIVDDDGFIINEIIIHE